MQSVLGHLIVEKLIFAFHFALVHRHRTRNDGKIRPTFKMATHNEEPWRLYYWPSIPGRGEFVRLVFEEAQVPYIDVGRVEGFEKVREFVFVREGGFPVAAPPVIQRGDIVLSQTMNICLFLAEKYGLLPKGDNEYYIANQVALTLADFVSEIHDVHHPISTALYYEDQKTESIKRAKFFSELRIPKFLTYLEKILESNASSQGKSLIGPSFSYVDLILFQVVSGLEYAFPRNIAKIKAKFPKVFQLKESVALRPNIASYLTSSRRKSFSESGIFRHYDELDIVPQ